MDINKKEYMKREQQQGKPANIVYRDSIVW